MMAGGKTTNAIAAALRIKRETARTYRKKVRRKLGFLAPYSPENY